MEENMFNWAGIAQLGYEAYGKSADWKNFRGEPMPRWDDLPEPIKQHWVEATREICDVFGRAVSA